MKYLSRSIIALSLLLSLWILSFSPVLAGRTTQPIQNCGHVRSVTGSASREAGESSGNVEVYLSEGIDVPSNVQLSCGEIINCLREKYREEGAKGNSQDALITQDLKEQFDFCIIAGKDGLGLLETYAALIYRWLAGIVGAVCVLVIIVSGIQISIGGMSQESVSEAKDRVVRALVGLVVIFLSAFILYTINPVFFA